MFSLELVDRAGALDEFIAKSVGFLVKLLRFGSGNKANRPEPVLLGSTLTLLSLESSSSSFSRAGRTIFTGPSLFFFFFAGGCSILSP